MAQHQWIEAASGLGQESGNRPSIDPCYGARIAELERVGTNLDRPGRYG